MMVAEIASSCQLNRRVDRFGLVVERRAFLAGDETLEVQELLRRAASDYPWTILLGSALFEGDHFALRVLCKVERVESACCPQLLASEDVALGEPDGGDLH